MGRRNHAETLTGIVDAFLESRTWRQADLARRVGVDTRTVRVVLEGWIESKRFPLERSVEGAHVYWSLPKRWVPGGVAIGEEDIAPLVRILAHAPPSPVRDRLLSMLLAAAPPRMPRPVEPAIVDALPRGDFEDRMLALAESAAALRRPLAVRYYTAGRQAESDRLLSIQRIQAGPPARLIAYCHTVKELRTFRVDNIRGAVVDHGVPFVHVDEEEVLAYVRRSVGGFHGPNDTQPVLCRFVVRDPEAGWVEKNLLSEMHAARIDGGIEVTATTAGVERVARFVVGLGSAAVCSTPELRDGVRALAEGALRNASSDGSPGASSGQVAS